MFALCNMNRLHRACSHVRQVSVKARVLTFVSLLLIANSLANKVMAKHSVFVYGTLKTGEPNHHWFNDENGQWTFIGKGSTVEKYPLIIGTKYNIPFLLYSPGNGTNVNGEVYEVDDKMLENLDRLEEHPTFYVREKKQISLSENSTLKECWIYFLKTFRPDLLNNTFFDNYSSTGDHGLRYMERYLRDPSNPAKNQICGTY